MNGNLEGPSDLVIGEQGTQLVSLMEVLEGTVFFVVCHLLEHKRLGALNYGCFPGSQGSDKIHHCHMWEVLLTFTTVYS
jgi:hypothetical protein